MRFKSGWLIAAGLALLLTVQARADTIVWGNNASFGNVTIEAFNSTTGAVVQQFNAPNAQAVTENGRGIAVLGHDIYYTTIVFGLNRGNIYKTNDTTHADLGVVVNTGLGGIANIATDGTYLYVSEYLNPTNQIRKYSTAGVLQSSVFLGGPDGTADGRDGFEVTHNVALNAQLSLAPGALTFIANRGDAQGPYDVYDAVTGAELIAGFINPGFSPTGIAYDGTYYYVSDIFNNELAKYDSLGNFLGFTVLGGPQPNINNGQRFLEDLSTVGNTVDNPPVSDSPEPASLILVGLSAFSLAGYAWRRRKAVVA